MGSFLQFLGAIFIPHPYLALIPAILFGILCFVSRSKTVLVASVLWLIYGLYEELHILRIICSGECNIRVDLLFIYIVLSVLSLLALLLGIGNLLKSKPRQINP